jgi:DNA-binding transcriptional MerR regulator
MAPKARVQKRLYYKIGEACKALDIQPYVLRYWETEFPALSPSKSRSGQRVYSERELEIIRRIKELLYSEGYTIAGAKKKLEAELASGSLGDSEAPEEEPGVEPAGADDTAPPARPRARAPSPPPPPAASGAGAEPAQRPLLLDTQAAERIESMRKGIQESLREAREILALLDAKSPPRSRS